MEVLQLSYRKAKKAVLTFWDEVEPGKFKTWTRLAHVLGVSREALCGMEKVIPKEWSEEERADFLYLLRKARVRIEADDHDRLYDKDQFKAALISLKNNHGWTEKQEVATDLSGGLEVVLSGELETYAG
jgi:hypothetical protein